VDVHSFKVPSATELAHDYLWRTSKALPERGRIGIFNRSVYAEVVVVRIHSSVLEREHLPLGSDTNPALWKDRYEDINAFERHLSRNGTRILKFFLHLSKDEQRKRLLERVDTPDKQWKLSAADMHERGYWDSYQRAYGESLSNTSTKWAPWYVIPADRKWFARVAIASVIVAELEALKLTYPAVGKEQRATLAAIRKELEEPESSGAIGATANR
jgi:PPK2 family polyphosphate:nucleotide phosphotransferase